MAERNCGDAVRQSSSKSLLSQMLTALPLGMCCLLSGCWTAIPDEAQKLVGSWQMMTDQEVRSSDVDDETLANRMARDSNRVDQAVGNQNLMRVEFSADGVLKTYALQEKTGSWKFESVEESGMVINVICDLGGEQVSTRVQFHSDDTISMVPPNIAVLERELMFKRE